MEGIEDQLNSDMCETDRTLVPLTEIADRVKEIDALICEQFRSHDTKARRDQKYHRYLAHLAVVSGTAAILFAVFFITNFLPRGWAVNAETFATGISVVAVLSGTLWAVQRDWLLERYKAESLRLLKFRSLLHPDFIDGNISMVEGRVKSEIDEINQIRKKDLHRILQSEGKFSLTHDICRHEFPEHTVYALAQYYRAKRLNTRIQYYHQRAKEKESTDRVTRNIPNILFSFGVLAVTAHFIIDRFIDGLHPFSTILVFFAIALPIISFGVKTYRSSNEFARNVSLFRAKEARLSEIASLIDTGLKDTPFDKRYILSMISTCEKILEEENREWLRLMSETEWFI